MIPRRSGHSARMRAYVLLLAMCIGCATTKASHDAGADAGSCEDAPIVPGTATWTGTINGNAFVPLDAFAARFLPSGDIGIVITDFANACFLAPDPAPSSSLLIFTFDPTTWGLAVEGVVLPATLNVGPFNVAAVQAAYRKFDAACKVTEVDVQSGTITITGFPSCAVRGSFDVILATGDELAGTFTAPVCVLALDDAGVISVPRVDSGICQ